MVGFPVEEELAVEVLDQDSKVKTSKDTLDFPSLDSFLDFDSFSFLGSNRNLNPEEFSIEDTDFDFFEMGQEGATETSQPTEVKPELCGDVFGEARVNPMIEVKLESCNDMSEETGVSLVMTEAELKVGAEPAKWSEPDVKPIEGLTASVDCTTMILDESELKKTEQCLASSIEVGLEKVSLTMDDDEKSDGSNGKNDSESETSSSSSGSSDSSSSEEEEESDEEENKKEKKSEDQMVMGKEDDVAVELEEGEIGSVDEDEDEDDDEGEEEDENEDEDDDDDDEVNEMVAWSNDEDEDLGLQTKEPIRSKNELKDLPPVPAVDVILEPHHATLPVGVVLSIMSTQVIVEGREKHSPLTEGSILWITEKRIPLGLVDEIFGPVKCPYYIVRFNSESEVPEGICQGTNVSFVVDFAQHILNIKELQKKGYDASGDNDEEISDELEFSDDEKEAEYKRMQKMEKRGMVNDQKTGNARNKKKKNRDLARHTSSYSGEWTENQGSSSHSDSQTGGPVSNLHLPPQMHSFPPNNAGWRPQNNQHNNPFQLPPMPNQMGMPNLSQMQIPLMALQHQNQMMFQPQFNGRPGGLNFYPGQPSVPWPALVGQNCFNQQPFGIQQQQQLPNELSFNMFAPPQGFQMHQPQPQPHMHRPQSPMNPQFQLQPHFQTHPQFQMQPQSETSPQSQIPQSPTNSQPQMQPPSQGFSSGQFSERGRGHRGRGRGRGRGRFGRGRGRGRQQS